MLNKERVLSEVEVLIEELQNTAKRLQKEGDSFQPIDFESLQKYLFRFEILVAESGTEIKEVLDVVRASMDNRTKVVQEALAKSPSQEERDKIALSDKVCGITERELLDKASTLSIKIINDVVTEIQEPAKRIAKATRKVQDAIKKLEDLNKQIGLLKSLIDIFSAVLTASINGVPALIGTLLEKVDTLTAESSG